MKRIITAKMISRSDKSREDFNTNFWDSVDAETKFAAAWEMINEVQLIRGEKNVRKQRLQRTVQNIQRRKC
jgi:hypothetical protein